MESTITAALSEDAGNVKSLSAMIQASAKAENCFVAWDLVHIRFPNEKAVRAFQDAFESFAHASKRTVKRVRAKERAEMAMKRPGKITA